MRKILVKAKIFPRSRVNSVEKVVFAGDELSMIIRVTALPSKGKANEAAIKAIAKFFDVTQASVELIKGHTCKNKVFRVSNVTHELIDKMSHEHWLTALQKISISN